MLKDQATIYKSNFLTANPYFKFSVVAPAKNLYIGVPKEVFPGEKRVALTPDAALKIIKTGFKVRVEKGAGEGAQIPDQKFVEAGCEIVDT